MKQNTPIITRCHACDAAMDVTAQPPFAKVICPRCGAANRVKREFGPYALKRRHAIGGMSMVFAAEDGTLGREVAIKILSEEYSADERRIAAFEREARLTAALSHPHVVRLFTTGRAFGRFYIAMEMVPGRHLEQWIIERGKIPEIEMLPLAIEVALGLKAARAAGLIHRDVKPGNILLDAEGHAKLVDFGLALVTHGGPIRPSEMWATPYYAPPETVAGLPEDFRSDIYAFGATLYHALSGQPSCPTDAMAGDVLAAAKKHVRPLAQVAPDISAATCRLVDHAMAYAPEDRHGSYDELIADLTAALAQLKSGQAESASSCARRLARERRRRHLAIAATGTGVLCAGALLMWRGTRPPPAIAAPPTIRPRMQIAGDQTTDAAGIAQRHHDAHAAIARRDFIHAQEQFLMLHQTAAVREPTRAWVGVEAVMAAWLDGRHADARQLAAKVRSHLLALPAGHPLAGGQWAELLQLAAQAKAPTQPIGKASAQLLMQAMLAGLGNWQMGRLEPAAACFKRVASIQLPADEQWPAVYQPIAEDYLADHAMLTGPLFAKQPSDPAACAAAVASLTELSGRIKTRGRARQLVTARIRELRQLASKAPITNTTPPPPAAAVDDPLTRLAEFTRDWRFAEAAGCLRELPEDPPGVSRSSLVALCESAAAFLRDIAAEVSASPFSGELPLKSGDSVRQLSVGSRGGLLVTTASGAVRRIQWPDLSPDALITIHRERVKLVTEEQQRNARHERAIAFDWLVGQRPRALAAAAKLAETDPAFRERWESTASGLPE